MTLLVTGLLIGFIMGVAAVFAEEYLFNGKEPEEVSSERTVNENVISLKDADAALEAAVQSYEAAHQNDVPEEVF